MNDAEKTKEQLLAELQQARRDLNEARTQAARFYREITSRQQVEYMLNVRVRQLHFLTEIGHKIDENPSVADLLKWVAQHLPQALQYPELGLAAIEFENQVYGDPQARVLPSRTMGGIRIGGELVGSLFIAYREPRPFLNEESSLLGGVISRISTYLERQHLIATLAQERTYNARRAAELATVAEVSTSVSGLLDPQEMLQSVVDLTQERFGLYHAHVYILDEPAGLLRLGAGAGMVGRQMTAQGWSIPLNQEVSLVARAARTRQTVVVNDTRTEAAFLLNSLLPNTLSEVSVPMIMGDQVLGVLDVQSDECNHFTPEDVAIVNTLAVQVGVALQNASTFEQAQRQAEYEALINAISQKIQTTTTVESALQVAVRELGRALNARRASVQLNLSQPAPPANSDPRPV